MKIALGPRSLRLPPEGCVATIGNFDGVHLGHRAVIERLSLEGKRLGVPVLVVLFEPQPLEFFNPDLAPPRLMRLREKIDRLSELPIDQVLVLRFNRKLAGMSPEAFIDEILIQALRLRFLVIGDDFRFGLGRRGDFRLLRETGHQAGFEVADTPSVMTAGHRISSTLIREALMAGNLDLAATLLGKPYEVCGRIIHGEKRGRTLGFPTANLKMQRRQTPVKGVFAVTMRGVGQNPLPGVANVGKRPTVAGDSATLLETHLIDYHGDLYGRRVEVEFHAKIRDERRFADLDELRTQIEQDLMAARCFFEDRRLPKAAPPPQRA